MQSNGNIGIPDPVPGFRDKRHRPFQQNFTVDSAELVRCIREMMPDISESQSAEKSIAQCMNGNIPVRMSYAAERTFDSDTAEIKREAFGQCMNVVSVSCSDFHIRFFCKFRNFYFIFACQSACGKTNVGGEKSLV